MNQFESSLDAVAREGVNALMDWRNGKNVRRPKKIVLNATISRIGSAVRPLPAGPNVNGYGNSTVAAHEISVAAHVGRGLHRN